MEREEEKEVLADGLTTRLNFNRRCGVDYGEDYLISREEIYFFFVSDKLKMFNATMFKSNHHPFLRLVCPPHREGRHLQALLHQEE